MADSHLIKKYANRRLYDTATSRHITLDGIHELIVQGHDVKVIDDTTGEDISRSILLQIIAEREQGGRPMLDTDLLTRILRLYGNPMQEVVGEFLSKSFDSFLKQQKHYQEQMRAAMAATPLATIQELTANNLKAWQAMQDALLHKDKNEDDD